MKQKIKLSKAVLLKKSDEQLKEILSMQFGYSLGLGDMGTTEIVELILELQDKMEEKEQNKFDFLVHLDEVLPMSEQMITDSFYSSSPAFRQKYLKEADITEERKKDIFYEVRDIVVANNLKVQRPDPSKKDKPVKGKPVKPKKVSPKTIDKVKDETPQKGETESVASKESGSDISHLVKKGDRVNYIIDLLIEEGGDIQKDIKAKGVMDRYMDVFDDSVSDGYAYDKVVERKKKLAV